MTALKRKHLKIVQISPSEFAEISKRSDLNLRLEAAARKADLLAYALDGVMAHEGNDDLWPLLRDELRDLAKKV